MIKKRFGTVGGYSTLTFSERVVSIALSIPRGKVTTYGRIARAAGGGTMASQSVTSILSKAYDSGVKKIPFHRIVYTDGRVWLNDAYREERLKKYKSEGIKIDAHNRVMQFERKLFDPEREYVKTKESRK